MKNKLIKILLIIFLSIISNNSTYSALDEYENKCNDLYTFTTDNLKLCTDNYYKSYDSKNKYYTIKKFEIKNIKPVPKEEEGLLFIRGTIKNYYKLLSKTIHKFYNNGELKINLYEYKYGNHIFYSIKNNNTKIDENEDIIGFYVDGEKILNFGKSSAKNDYNSIKSFFEKNNIIVYLEETDESLSKNTDIILSEKVLKILNNFVLKVEKIKYSKNKLLEKIEKLSKIYKTKKDEKSKRITEMLLHLHSEVLINKLKQSKKLETINSKIQ